jgi:hypothetical protein
MGPGNMGRTHLTTIRANGAALLSKIKRNGIFLCHLTYYITKWF